MIYRGYKIITGEGRITISLKGEDAGTDPFGNGDESCKSIADAKQWIDEDIKCREEEKEDEKKRIAKLMGRVNLFKSPEELERKYPDE